MGVHKTVFGSNQERKYYKKLTNTWGEQLNIYHNLPFLSVFKGREPLIDSDTLQMFNLNDNEFELLKKTSIDYVICNRDDKPLLCIDFDGMQGGFNVGKKYVVPDDEGKLKRRKDFFELKLRVAHGSGFPFFVLSSEHFKGLANSIYLTIADGLIGEILSTNACMEGIGKGFDPAEYGYFGEDFEELDELTKRDLIEDWAISIEVKSDYLNNPIFQKVAELSKETGSSGYSIKYLNGDEKDSDVWSWVECEVTNREHGNENAKVYLPNFKTPSCYFSIHLAQGIARLLALEKIKRRMKAAT